MRFLPRLLPLLGFIAGLSFALPTHAAESTPLRVLLVTGGCCHDYPTQTKALQDAVAKFGPVEWIVINEGGNGTKAQIGLYEAPDWAKPFDVVVHNECFADTDDSAYLAKIVAGHRAGVPAVVIHCAMHSYRASTDDAWREFLGVTSRRHDHESNYVVRPVAPAHAVLRGFPALWTTPRDELYVIERLWPTATALAVAKSEQDGRDYPVIWMNNHHGTRVFGTTFGHGNATWFDPVYAEYVARGLFWAAGRELRAAK